MAFFPPTATAVLDVRASTVRTLDAWSVMPATVSRCAVVVSDLATHAVRASGPDDEVAVQLAATHQHVVLDVWDRNTAGTQLAGLNVEPERAREMLLVDALSSHWSRHTAHGGMVVRAVVSGGIQPALPDADPTLPRRTQTATPRCPGFFQPVSYQFDPAILGRVLEGLRALDSRPAPAASTSAVTVPAR
jgi:hypothetical protein